MSRFTTIRDNSALRIALIYAAVSAVWIVTSDLLVSALVQDPRQRTLVFIAKGWGFILITAFLLYALVRQAITRIWHSEAQARLIFDSVNDAIYLYSLDENGLPGKIIDANEVAVRQLGYPRARLLTMTALERIKPELRTKAGKWARQLMSKGRVVFETVFTAEDGRDIPVEISSRIVQLGNTSLGVSIVRDIATRKREEEEHREALLAAERDKRRFYRETILAVTGGKFVLGDPEEAQQWIRDPMFSAEVTNAEQIAEVRHEVLRFCRDQGLDPQSAVDFELAIGEALTNALKHTAHGWVCAGRRDDSVWVAVVDHGSGIDTFALPKVAIMPGFTTKASMGLGYTLILEASDCVRLATGPDGTTVVMEKRLTPVSEEDRRIRVFSGIK